MMAGAIGTPARMNQKRRAEARRKNNQAVSVL
jgi:hypothetical protein